MISQERNQRLVDGLEIEPEGVDELPPLNSVQERDKLPKVLRVRKIKIARIKHHQGTKPDEENVQLLCRSLERVPLMQPIAVSRIKGTKPGEYAIIFGNDRLAALKLRGERAAYCLVMEATPEQAVEMAIFENYARKSTTKLQRAELEAALVDLVAKGQNVAKHRKAIKLTALTFPDTLRTTDAQRKHLERSCKIRALPEKVKKAAIEAGLDNSQSFLLSLAKKPSEKKQLELISDRSLSKVDQEREIATNPKGEQAADDQDSPLNESSGKGTAEASNDSGEAQATEYEALVKAWKESALPDLWKLAPRAVRNQFIEKIGHARVKINVDAVEFLTSLFAGRKWIWSSEIYKYAEKAGLTESETRKALRGRYKFKYKKSKDGRTKGRWYNTSKTWKDEIRSPEFDERNRPNHDDEYYAKL